VVHSLQFDCDRRRELLNIDAAEWPDLLKLTDRSQLTLPLGLRCREFVPDAIRARMDHNLASNRVRHERLFREYELVASGLAAKSVDYVVLKGVAQIAPFYVSDPCHRPQYDIDLYCPRGSLASALEVLREKGFAAASRCRNHIDHVPAMVRERNWKWTGDYYHPDLPISVELHFRFWDSDTERISVPHLEDFWLRRTGYMAQGVRIPMLALSDGISYSALHLVRHLLRGDLRIYHVYELAHFLNHTAADDELWGEYLDNRGGYPSKMDAVAFCLAHKWFACHLHPIVREAIDTLPPSVRRWFDVFGDSPLTNDRPNKDELFLHLALVGNAVDRCRILRRRLVPVHGLHVAMPSDEASSLPRRILAKFSQPVRFLAGRTLYHLRTAVSLLTSLFRWRFAGRRYATF
jgi:hypothetical protein